MRGRGIFCVRVLIYSQASYELLPRFCTKAFESCCRHCYFMNSLRARLMVMLMVTPTRLDCPRHCDILDKTVIFRWRLALHFVCFFSWNQKFIRHHKQSLFDWQNRSAGRIIISRLPRSRWAIKKIQRERQNFSKQMVHICSVKQNLLHFGIMNEKAMHASSLKLMGHFGWMCSSLP